MYPEKAAVMKWLKPEPASDEELRLAASLEPGDYEVFGERLNMIVAEAAEVFVRVGISAMLHSGDLICGLYTPQGDMVTANCGTFLHAVTAQLPIKWIMANYKDNPSVGVNDGDVFYCNDARYGGIHNPDQIAVMPIFHEGELVAWSAAAVHQPETGATEPGGMPPAAKTRHYEGMKLPPIKLAENFRIKDDVMEFMINMISRTPRMQSVDVRARMAGCDRIRVRVQELTREKGADFLKGLFRKMIQVSEDGARRKISRWNDGVYRDMVFLSVVGPHLSLMRICLTLRKEGDRVIFDYAGTSPENDTAYNTFPWVVAAHTAVYLYSYIFYDLPISVGSMAPLEFHVPEGCMLNANPEAAISCAVLLCKSMFLLSPLTFARMIYSSEDRDLVISSPGNSCAATMAGPNQWGMRYSGSISIFNLNTTGQGARLDDDGMDSALFPHCFVAHGPDMEDHETNLPVLTLFQKHNLDSCGHGQFRGGSGTQGGYILPYTVPFTALLRVDHQGWVPFNQGLFGGYAPAPFPELIVHDSNVLDLLESGAKDIPMSIHETLTTHGLEGEYHVETGSPGTPHQLKSGGYFIAVNSGGSGYGDVLDREPQSVSDDVKNKIISDWTARNVYHVDYDSETFAVDPDKTAELHTAEREARKKRGKPYAEFMKDWVDKKPVDQALEYFGSWPEAKKVREIVRV